MVFRGNKEPTTTPLCLFYTVIVRLKSKKIPFSSKDFARNVYSVQYVAAKGRAQGKKQLMGTCLREGVVMCMAMGK